MMLTMPEELLLIAYDDQTGKMSRPAPTYIHYGLAGAILMELTMRGCLDFQNKKVVVVENADAGDELFNNYLQFLKQKQKGKAKSLYHYVRALGTYIKRHKKYLLFMERLVEQGILKREETKFLFFTKEVYPSIDAKEENAIRARLKKALRQDVKEIDEQTFTLIALLRACRLNGLVFSKEEDRAAKHKITEMMKNSLHGEAVSNAIQTMQVALLAAVSSSVTATSSNTSGL